MRFDEEAKLWDEKPRRVALGKAVSEYVSKYINKDSEVLDFGCGTGLVSLNFCNKAKTIVGVDLSCEMINIYNKKAKSIKCNAIGICDDVINIKEKFDIITASMVFHHIENIDEIMGILSEKLKPNGKLFVADLAKEDGSFHDKGNNDVYHFGFSEEDFIHDNFMIKDFSKIYTIQKHKEFDVYIAYLEKRGV